MWCPRMWFTAVLMHGVVPEYVETLQTDSFGQMILVKLQEYILTADNRFLL